ncbi:MAG: HlyD family efflux transporter periplasmic adaptor subunit [Acidobacteriia bacterium]|nr:HlyD family efflux transporter periplasmic adaptor subunit [Terriglobia bacterium]
MDIPRKSQARKRRILRTLYAILVLALAAGITLALRRLKPAPPSVEFSTVWVSTVKRGNIKREVRGPGTLVPEEIRWVAAQASGRVERRLVQPGAFVKPDTVLIELSNPQLEQEVLTALSDWKSSESDFTDYKVKLEVDELNTDARLAQLESDYSTAKMRSEAQDNLALYGLTTDLDVRQARETAANTARQLDLQRKLKEKNKESIVAQLAIRQRAVDKLHAVYDLKNRELMQLKVRAGVDGVLQEMKVEEGKQIGIGTDVARVANPRKLKAELKIMETQAKDVQLGQIASIDMHGNSLIPGRVIRKDPTVLSGTVTVDVALDGDLPKGAIPDLSVDGTIELERLNDVVYVERPTQGQEGSTIGLFKLTPDGKEASRVQVKIGRVSVSTVEILGGLNPGDRVILSDMSAQDAYDRIRIIY